MHASAGQSGVVVNAASEPWKMSCVLMYIDVVILGDDVIGVSPVHAQALTYNDVMQQVSSLIIVSGSWHL